MVDDRITDSKRIAQLLASELTGLESGTLAAVDVVDADPDATPTESGTVAYRVKAEGREIAAVLLFPERVEVHFGVAPPSTPDGATRGVSLNERTLELTSGAAVKSAADVIRETVDAVESDRF